VQHHAIIVETCFKNGDPVVKTEQILRKRFNIACHGKVFCHSTIQLRTQNFRTSASALKKKPFGSVCTV
jgi:hypothetical protein